MDYIVIFRIVPKESEEFVSLIAPGIPILGVLMHNRNARARAIWSLLLKADFRWPLEFLDLPNGRI